MYVSSYRYVCVLILLYMCPHPAIYLSSYCYISVLIPLYMCPHTAMAMHVSSYCYVCVLILEIARRLRCIMVEDEKEKTLGPLGTQFTRFTSTKERILTPEELSAHTQHLQLAVAQLCTLLATELPRLSVFTNHFWPIEYIVGEASQVGAGARLLHASYTPLTRLYTPLIRLLLTRLLHASYISEASQDVKEVVRESLFSRDKSRGLTPNAALDKLQVLSLLALLIQKYKY